MNASFLQVPGRHVELVELVDFKWLMAGQGVWVDLTRWREDASYADACIASGLCSHCDALRACAARLQFEIHDHEGTAPDHDDDHAAGPGATLVQ